MAIPAIVGTPTGDKGTGSLTITLGAGLSVVAITTEAQNLPTAGGATQISHADSGWTAIVGTKGGAGYSAAGQYLYVFWKVTTASETITTGDSGVFQVYDALTVSGYNAASSFEATTQGSGTLTVTTGICTVPGITTLGPDRLIVGFVNPRIDATSNGWSATWVNSNLSSPTTLPSNQSNAGSGGGMVGFRGGYAADADGAATGDTTNDTSQTTALAHGYAILAIKPAPDVVYNDTASGTITLSGSVTETWGFVYTDTATGTLALSGSVSEDYQPPGGGPTYDDSVAGRVRVKA